MGDLERKTKEDHFFIVVSGNEAVGYTYHGPFTTDEDAEREAQRHEEDDTCIIVPLYGSVFGVSLDDLKR